MKQITAFFVFYTFLLFSNHSESSYPYISGYTWWHFCDWKLTNPDYGKSTYARFDPEQVQPGDTIFVEYDCLDLFGRKYLPHLKNRVILITGNYGYHSDTSLPGLYAYFLNDDRIAAWFVQNIDRPPTEKLIPIPIGLASNYWPHGNVALIDIAVPLALQSHERSSFIYLNFSIASMRFACVNHFTLMGLTLEPRKTYVEYLRDLTKAVFVPSPLGGGIDCHRTWEALLMGCYPIVESTTLDSLFAGLPVVIVQNWDEVTSEFLEAKYVELKAQNWSREKLYSPYWFEKVRDIQDKIRRDAPIPDEIEKKINQHVASNSWGASYYEVLPELINHHKYKNILEVGVALGGHAEAILSATNINTYMGVDPYQCYDLEDGLQQDVAAYSSLQTQKNFDYLYQWVSHVRLKPFGERCKLIRKTSVEASLDFSDESLDCIFIDGDHNYEPVLHDLRAWFPKLKKGHLIIGDDYSMEPVARAVDEFFTLHDKKVLFFHSKSGYKLWAVYK